MAEAAVAAFRVAVEVPRRRAGTGDFWFEGLTDVLFENLLPRALAALETLGRHAVAGTTVQLWATDEQEAATTRHLHVGFADMVGFTARSQALATADLVAVIDRFERGAADVIARHGGRLIKLIGDGVMYAATDGDAACAIALELVETTGRAGLSDVRAGLAVGRVISRSGDFYGPVVNLAARLASVASPGEVLATAAVGQGGARDRVPHRGGRFADAQRGGRGGQCGPCRARGVTPRAPAASGRRPDESLLRSRAMSLEITREDFTEADHARFAERLQQSLDVLARLLTQEGFGTGPATLGAELELTLVDPAGRPLPVNRYVLAAAVDPRVSLEIDRFNLEVNARPVPLGGRAFTALGGRSVTIGTAPAPPSPRPVRAATLVLELLPVARGALLASGVDAAEVEALLEVIAVRVARGRTGARWQRRTLADLERRVARETGLRELVGRYLEHAASGRPVHDWPVDG
jgi:class 3 adenylate cyclase